MRLKEAEFNDDFILTGRPLFKRKTCDVHVHPERKSSIVAHMSGARHIAKLGAVTDTPPVDFNASLYRSMAKHEFTFATTLMLTACNIPLQVTSNKSIQTWVKT